MNNSYPVEQWLNIFSFIFLFVVPTAFGAAGNNEAMALTITVGVLALAFLNINKIASFKSSFISVETRDEISVLVNMQLDQTVKNAAAAQLKFLNKAVNQWLGRDENFNLEKILLALSKINAGPLEQQILPAEQLRYMAARARSTPILVRKRNSELNSALSRIEKAGDLTDDSKNVPKIARELSAAVKILRDLSPELPVDFRDGIHNATK